MRLPGAVAAFRMPALLAGVPGVLFDNPDGERCLVADEAEKLRKGQLQHAVDLPDGRGCFSTCRTPP